MGLSPFLFIYFRLFYKQFTVNNCSIKVAGDRIQTRVLWYQKQPRCQLCHITAQPTLPFKPRSEGDPPVKEEKICKRCFTKVERIEWNRTVLLTVVGVHPLPWLIQSKEFGKFKHASLVQLFFNRLGLQRCIAGLVIMEKGWCTRGRVFEYWMDNFTTILL